MLPRERQIEIVKLADRHGTVKTSELAELLNCTEETIRRDLDSLEKEDRLVRTHGGAMSVEDSSKEVQHHKRESREVKAKKMIGELACSHIRAGETIFIDESSTALAMVDFLPNDIEFSVVTPSQLVSKRVSQMRNIQLYLLGGLYDELSHSFGGYIAEQAMRSMTVDRFYFSCKGIDVKQGATEASEKRARLKRNLLESAKWTCALVDNTKIAFKSKFSFIFPELIDLIITDNASLAEELDKFEASGVKTQTKSN